ncbi:MAG: FtsB family cell division protein [Actinomycetota bacterium]
MSSPETSQPRHGRRAVYALVASALALSVLYPLRQYSASRAELRAMVRTERSLDEQAAALVKQKTRLSSDAEVERQAREHLHMVRPGEVAFAITGAAPVPQVSPPAVSDRRKPGRGWLSSFWHWLTGN